LDSKKEFIITALIDSGCTHSTIDSDFVRENGLTTTLLEYPRLVRNADGTENKEGRIMDCLEVMMEVTGKDHQERIDFAITKLGSHKMFLGYDWIHTHNPSIDWHSGTINFDRCPPKFNCQNSSHSMTPWARVQANISAEIAAAKESVKEKWTWREIVPSHYHKYEMVFTKESFDALPERRPWDHAIDLKEGSDPILDC
jgi:Aspartyl protease